MVESIRHQVCDLLLNITDEHKLKVILQFILGIKSSK